MTPLQETILDKNPPANAGTQVQALIQENSTCHRATKTVPHNYWAQALGPHEPQLLSLYAPTTEARVP